MSKKNFVGITLPPGRLVQGSCYEPNTEDAQGRQLVYKTGPNKGQPRVDYFLAVAIPKTGEGHWASTEWGAKIWAFGYAEWTGGQPQRPDFAWKITDGDSDVPNKKNVKPKDCEGFPGHWIVKMGGGYAPKIVNADGSQPIVDAGAVKLGYYVQVYVEVSSNQSTETAGMYINHRIVALSGFGPEISYGPNASEVGFGKAPLPPGASTVPLAAMTAAASVPSAPTTASGTPPAPGAAVNAPPPPGAGAVPTPPASTTFTAGAAGAAPPPPGTAAAAPPPPPVRTMTAKAGATTYDAFKTAGWTDEALIAEGMMTA